MCWFIYLFLFFIRDYRPYDEFQPDRKSTVYRHFNEIYLHFFYVFQTLGPVAIYKICNFLNI